MDAAEVDETPNSEDTPRLLAARLAVAKGRAVAPRHAGSYVLAADTVVAVGRRVLPKPMSAEEGRACLALLSGRAHRVLTAICVLSPDGRQAQRLVESKVRFKRLTAAEIEGYVRSDEGLGKAGGYAIQGRAAAFVMTLQGSYSSVVGLPLYESSSLLTGLGYRLP